MSSIYPGQGSQPPYRAASSVRRSEWDRRDPQGWLRAIAVGLLSAVVSFAAINLLQSTSTEDRPRAAQVEAPVHGLDEDAPPRAAYRAPPAGARTDHGRRQ
jgi:hypothetical protein